MLRSFVFNEISRLPKIPFEFLTILLTTLFEYVIIQL